MIDVEKIKKIAHEMRIDIIKMIYKAGSGHPGGSLSSVEIVAVLYFHVMKHNPSNLKWEERDRFILSKAHVCPVLYAAMAESCYFPKEELLTFRKLGSRLQGHPHMSGLPGLETSAGSLGQGLSIATGSAIGFKMDQKPNRVYCLLGDGELDEGQVWEASMTASHYKLDNLCAIVDRNGLQIDGNTEDVKKLEPLPDKWKAFGWHVIVTDGHDILKLSNAFDEAKNTKDKPTVIITKTIKGKGVSFMENKAEWHGKAPNHEQYIQALKDLNYEGEI